MASTTKNVGAGGPSSNTTMAGIAHLLALCTWLVGPVVLLVVTDDEFVKSNARNAVNWQICLTIYSIVVSLFVVVTALVGIGFMIPPVLLPALGLINLAFIVIAAVKATGGEVWSYPLTIDFL